jgi:hypothetical protein
MSLEAGIVAVLERIATEIKTRTATETELGGVKSGGVPERFPEEDWASVAEMWVDPSTGISQSYYLAFFFKILNGWMNAEVSTTLEPDQRIIFEALKPDVQDMLAKANSSLQNLTERNAWAATTAYSKGDIVTSQYARWYCKTAHTSASTWAETNWVHLGLYAIGATSDPGVPGRLWVDVT